MKIPKVIDADGHIYENHEEIEEYFEGKYRVCAERAPTRFSPPSTAGRAGSVPGVPTK